MVSHDLQNPLMALLMKASLLQRQVAPRRTRRVIARGIDGIVRAGKQMNELLRLLVDATAIEKGRLIGRAEVLRPGRAGPRG